MLTGAFCSKVSRPRSNNIYLKIKIQREQNSCCKFGVLVKSVPAMHPNHLKTLIKVGRMLIYNNIYDKVSTSGFFSLSRKDCCFRWLTLTPDTVLIINQIYFPVNKLLQLNRNRFHSNISSCSLSSSLIS